MRAVYGSVALRREYCPACACMAIVLDRRLQCCDRYADDVRDDLVRMSGAEGIPRRKPTKGEREKILKGQDGRCFYCRSVFGDTAFNSQSRKGTYRVLSPCWDHVEPYCWQANNQAINFVAACSICNGYKGSKMFQTMEECIAYVTKRRRARGWRTATEAGAGDGVLDVREDGAAQPPVEEVLRAGV